MHVPNHIRVPGKESFQGDSFHSAHWPAEFSAQVRVPSLKPQGLLAFDHVDSLTMVAESFSQGKRIAVVGSAASAIQIVPCLQREAQAVYIVQRTPNWILPRNDFAIPTWLQWMLRYVPGLLLIVRTLLYARQEYLFRLLFDPSSSSAKAMAKQAKVLVTRGLQDMPPSDKKDQLIQALTPQARCLTEALCAACTLRAAFFFC